MSLYRVKILSQAVLSLCSSWWPGHTGADYPRLQAPKQFHRWMLDWMLQYFTSPKSLLYSVNTSLSSFHEWKIIYINKWSGCLVYKRNDSSRQNSTIMWVVWISCTNLSEPFFSCKMTREEFYRIYPSSQFLWAKIN